MSIRALRPSLFLVLSLCGGCVGIADGVGTPPVQGKLTGKVALGWEGTQDYVYLPVENKPLTYVIPDTIRISDDEAVNKDKSLRTIRPGLMYTDGGSIPRIFWASQGLSPFDYMPAYVVHDWFYLQHRCAKVGKAAAKPAFPYSKDLADAVLKDSLDQLDANRKNDSASAAQVRKLIFQAVGKFGDRAWNGQDCRQPPPPDLYVFRDRPIAGGKRTGDFQIYRRQRVKTNRYRIIAEVDAGG
jgi:hypothetical protein